MAGRFSKLTASELITCSIWRVFGEAWTNTGSSAVNQEM